MAEMDRTITLTDPVTKKEIKADILFTYHSDEFERDYVFFIVRDANEVSVLRYVAENESETEGNLLPIETDEEWAMIEEVYNDYTQDVPDCEGGCENCSSKGHCDIENEDESFGN